MLEAILDAPGVVAMLGAVDVGKTTTATAIASAVILAKRRTAVVDTDIGQSDIGPPTTVGLSMPRRPARRMREWDALAAFFVGDTSPRDVYPYLIEGAIRSIEQARARQAEVIVMDTTGWIEGAAAVAAKTRKLRRIDPQHVVAIQRQGEVEPILERLPRRIAVHRLRPSSRVRRRSREVRRAARVRRFHQYFLRARPHTLPLGRLLADRLPVYEGREVPQAGMLTVIPAWALRHLLVGLADRDGWLRALGTVVETAPALQTVTVMAPLQSVVGVSVLQWGVLRVAPSGIEVGRLA
ncbi:MAG TPA: Clp1/GlmU family protein [bacterium]|nr:Clp1/GlmU family protein [bacterium]